MAGCGGIVSGGEFQGAGGGLKRTLIFLHLRGPLRRPTSFSGVLMLFDSSSLLPICTIVYHIYVCDFSIFYFSHQGQVAV